MRPCDGRGGSATRRDRLAGNPIEIGSESIELHARAASERRDRRFCADESMPTQRGKLADADSIPGHHEGFALVKPTHDLAAVVAKLALTDFPGHIRSVAQVLHAARSRYPVHTRSVTRLPFDSPASPGNE